MLELNGRYMPLFLWKRLLVKWSKMNEYLCVFTCEQLGILHRWNHEKSVNIRLNLKLL